MSEAWMPVLFAAVIVLGVVGGTVMQTVLKEVLPLLRTMVAGRQAVSGQSGNAELQERVSSLEQQLASVQARQRELGEEAEFLQNLLSSRSEPPVVSSPE